MADPVVGKVDSIQPEARRAVTIEIDLLEQPFSFQAGQAIFVDPHQFKALLPQIQAAEKKKGTPLGPRAFSCSSPPSQRASIEISVKMEDNTPFPPILSPYFLEGLKPGDPFSFTGPVGRFTLPEDIPEGIAGCVHVVAGSAVAPIRSILKESIAANQGLRHLLFLQNRTEEDIFFHQELKTLEAKHPNLCKVVHVLSHPDVNWTERKGYIDLAVIGREMEGFLTTGECFGLVCGPNRRDARPGFLDLFAGNPKSGETGILQELGLPKDRIIVERW